MADTFVNAFIGNGKEPTAAELGAALGPAKRLWEQLQSDLAVESGVNVQEWHSYSHKAGWAMKMKLRERTIVYLSPSRGFFRASFVLGDKAVQAALHDDLPASVVKLIKQAKRYAEGTAVRIEVKKMGDLTVVKKLAAIKVES
jgi:hypothetical protein